MDQREILADFRSAKCRCGNRKQIGRSFCGRCYYRLSKPMRNALYLPIGKGYEQAFRDACEALKAANPSHAKR